MKETTKHRGRMDKEQTEEEEEKTHQDAPERDPPRTYVRHPEVFRTKHLEDPKIQQARQERDRELKGKEKLHAKGVQLAKEATKMQRGEKRYFEAFQKQLDENEQLILLRKRARLDAKEKQRIEDEAEALKQQ